MNQRHSVAASTARDRRGDEGAALVVTLLLMLAFSVAGASMLMLAQTETYASTNYRTMSQARYGAESGVMRAANYLTQVYQAPGAPADPIASYNTAVSPVTWNNIPVVLSADPNKASNYPDAAKRAAFAAAAQGTMDAGQLVTYGSYATLLSMRTILEYASNAPTVVTTWQITGTGSLGGTRPATVEVAMVLERSVSSAYSFGVFTTGTGCDSLKFSGGSLTDSYNSTNFTLVNGAPVTQLSGGNAGTNGSFDQSGSSAIWGSLSTPRTGVGNCTAGAVTAIDGLATSVHGGLIPLPQAITFPTPEAPSPVPPTTGITLSSGACASFGFAASACSGSPGNLTLDAQGGTMLLGNVLVSGGKTVHLRAGTYNVNSIVLSGGSQLVVDTGPVYMNVTGAGTTNPINWSGGSVANLTFNPQNFRLSYGGSSPVVLSGGSGMAGIFYMPNAAVTMSGGSHLYGAIVASTLLDSGGTQMHYDRSLSNSFMVAGNYTLSAFTWKKY